MLVIHHRLLPLPNNTFFAIHHPIFTAAPNGLMGAGGAGGLALITSRGGAGGLALITSRGGSGGPILVTGGRDGCADVGAGIVPPERHT